MGGASLKWVGVTRSNLFKTKKQSHFCNGLILRAENETRTHASRVWFLANYIYTPDPWKGSIGVARLSHHCR